MRTGSDELMVSTYLDALPSPMPAYLHTHCLGLHMRQWIQWIPKAQLQQLSRTDRHKAIHMLRHVRLPVMLKTELAAQLQFALVSGMELCCQSCSRQNWQHNSMPDTSANWKCYVTNMMDLLWESTHGMDIWLSLFAVRCVLS